MVLDEPIVRVLTAAPVPMLIVSAEASSPIASVPVVPELMVRPVAVAEERITAPAPV